MIEGAAGKTRINFEITGDQRAQPHHAEMLVAHHHRVGPALLVAGKHAGTNVVHISILTAS